jgi:hypothetical protein
MGVGDNNSVLNCRKNSSFDDGKVYFGGVEVVKMPEIQSFNM